MSGEDVGTIVLASAIAVGLVCAAVRDIMTAKYDNKKEHDDAGDQ